jgi:putative PIG3 family NAD(P)H quinone oxidoreductase
MTWAEVPDPEPGPGEVLIDVVAAGVNRADLLQRAGFYNPPPGASPIPGMECSGRISAVGQGVTRWRVGDEVCALLSGGGYAEKVVVPAGQVLPVPDGVDLVDAAAFPEIACTVWSNLTRVAHMSHWQTLLVHGGGSGIGTFALQYASALGVRVLTTARRAKHEVLKALGADVTIDYTEQDFVAEVMAATSNRGVELILDIQGASYLNRNIEALADGGCVVIIGLQGGRTGEIDLGAMLAKRATVAATTLRTRTTADKASIVAGVRAEVWPLIEAKKILAVVDRTVPMSQAATAHEIMATSDHIGKILLVTEPRLATGGAPLTETALPVTETALPVTETALPVTETALPVTETVTDTAIPATETAIPLTETAIPVTEIAPAAAPEEPAPADNSASFSDAPPTTEASAASAASAPEDPESPEGQTVAEPPPVVARGTASVGDSSGRYAEAPQYPAHQAVQPAPGSTAPGQPVPPENAETPA